MTPPDRKICPHCAMLRDDATRRQQDTAYEDDEKNFVECCEDCIIEINAYWAERWAEYYGGLL